jgi:transcriptional regulator with XRE-family HTH domain
MKIKREFIQELIKRKSLKQKDVALMLGLSQQDFNNSLHRRIMTDFKQIEKLADILAVNVDDIIEKEEFKEGSKEREEAEDFLVSVKRLQSEIGIGFKFSYNNRGGEKRIIIQGSI